MEEILKQILSKVSAMEEGQNKILKRLDNLEGEVSTIKDDMATKVQQDEKTQIIKAILHNTETANAEINALKLTTLSKEALSYLATKDDIGDTNDHLKALNERLFHQEAVLSHLKAVK